MLNFLSQYWGKVEKLKIYNQFKNNARKERKRDIEHKRQIEST